MNDIDQLSEKSKKILSEANQAIVASGAIILGVQKEIEDIEQKAKENMRELSLLL